MRTEFGEAELALKMKTNETDQNIKDLEINLESAETERDSALESSKLLEEKNLEIVEVTERNQKEKMYELESQLASQEEKSREEMETSQQESEENLSQLKHFFEMEKTNIEKKVNEIKDKSERRQADLIDEHTIRLEDSKNMYDEEIEQIQDELRDKDMQLQ